MEEEEKDCRTKHNKYSIDDAHYNSSKVDDSKEKGLAQPQPKGRFKLDKLDNDLGDVCLRAEVTYIAVSH